jgi:membrane-associated phospholipid phosphatase
MGLGLSLALAFFFTQGMKNIFGKPRPDLLARCDPNMDRIEEFTVGGGYGAQFNPTWVLVSAGICRTSMSDEKLKDGFRSFPSGHSSSTSFAPIHLDSIN